MPQFGVADSPDVEVLHINVPVGGSLPLAPQQQTLLSRRLWKQMREGAGDHFIQTLFSNEDGKQELSE